MPKGRIIWESDTLTPGLAELRVRTHERVETIVRRFAQVAEEYAKSHARWEDRTGDARAGLETEYFSEEDVVGFVLAHTVDYGLWLEVRWNGRYAIIMPTAETVGRTMMADMRDLLNREVVEK